MASPTVQLNDGTSMPWLAFGSGTKHRDTDASKHISDAIKAGFRHIDCAQMYGNEESVGKGLADAGVPRAEMYITTKLDKLAPGVTVRDALMASLKKLQTDYVDLFLIHVPIVHDDLKATWKEMEACKAQGLAKSIGVSNFQPKHLEEIIEGSTVLPAVNQIELHPYVYKASQPLLNYMKQYNILPSSFGGLTPIAYLSGGPVDPILSRIVERLSNASGKHVTNGQVLQLWLRKKGVPCITTTDKLDRLKEYLDSMDLPAMSDEEEREIDVAGSRVHHRRVVRT